MYIVAVIVNSVVMICNTFYFECLCVLCSGSLYVFDLVLGSL